MGLKMIYMITVIVVSPVAHVVVVVVGFAKKYIILAFSKTLSAHTMTMKCKDLMCT